MDRQEIVSLEKEAAHAIQLNDGGFFRRIYSDEFSGTLSHGQQVNKVQWIQAIESPSVKRESFTASDIKVRIFENTAIVTCLWSSRFVVKGQMLSSQLRAIHVYVNTTSGWRVFSGQSTNLPPDVQQPL
jgi:ketosteroid isomerase-like protein